jgi:hypothetical protein
MNRLKSVAVLGQSVWLDFIDRDDAIGCAYANDRKRRHHWTHLQSRHLRKGDFLDTDKSVAA